MCDDNVEETPEFLKDFAMEVYDVIRDIRDPEKPETLEELEVLTEESVVVQSMDESATSARCHYRIQFFDHQ